MEDSVAAEVDLNDMTTENRGAETAGGSADETPPSKSRSKANDDQTAAGSVGIGDIRKAVAFSNSVGGLDKAIALLQILKVAKEVQ